MLRYRDFAIIIVAALTAALFLKAYVLDAVVIPSASMEETLLPGDFVLVNKLSVARALDGGAHSSMAFIPFLPHFFQRAIHTGDIVVFKFPTHLKNTVLNEHDLLVKRVIGKSGDVVEIQKRKIWVNGEEATRIAYDRNAGDYNASDDFFPPRSNYNFEHYGPIRVPRQGDILELTKESFSEWENLIREEGHSVAWSDNNCALIDGKPERVYVVKKNYFFVIGDNFYHSYDSRFWGFLPEDDVIGQAAVVYWSLGSDSNTRSLRGFINSIRWDRIGRFIR